MASNHTPCDDFDALFCGTCSDPDMTVGAAEQAEREAQRSRRRAANALVNATTARLRRTSAGRRAIARHTEMAKVARWMDDLDGARA